MPAAQQKRRFTFRGKTYTVPSFDEVNLKDIIQFDQQAEAMGISARWKDIVDLARRSDKLNENEAAGDTLSYVMTVVTIWTARRAAGETCSFDEASEMTLSEVEWIPVPKDRQQKAAKKATPTRKGSVVADPAEADLEQTT